MVVNGNEVSTQNKGGIATIYKECKFYDPFEHHHSDQSNTKSYVKTK